MGDDQCHMSRLKIVNKSFVIPKKIGSRVLPCSRWIYYTPVLFGFYYFDLVDIISFHELNEVNSFRYVFP